MSVPSAPKRLLLLVDGHSLAFRAYYAFAHSRNGPLRTATGIPTSVCFGFLNSLLQVVEQVRPQALAIAFDRREPTFRHEADTNYKADRQETPEDFLVDMGYLRQLLEALNLATVSYAGYEADDVLGTLACQAVQEGYQVKILSGDRDLFQLVDRTGQITVLYLSRNPLQTSSSYQEMDWQDVTEKMGVTPAQIVDYKALCGDSSDNIPGVRGIGEKTAVKLLQEYQTLDNLYAHLAQVKGALKTKLQVGRPEAEHSRHLAQIIQAVPLKLALTRLTLQGFTPGPVAELCHHLELRSLAQKLPHIQGQLGGTTLEILADADSEPTTADEAPQQLSLFQASLASAALPVPAAGSALATLAIKPRIIHLPQQLASLVQCLQAQTDPDHPVAWDTETDGLDPFCATLVGLGCAWGPGPEELAYIPLAHHQGEQLPLSAVLAALQPILESSHHPKVLQNAKFDRLILQHQGIQLQGVVFDTMLASYILHPEQSHNLTDLCRRYLPDAIALSYKDLGLGKGQTIADLDIATAALYCGLDAHSTYRLQEKLNRKLAAYPLLQALFTQVELPLEPILAAMEDRGIRINVSYLHQLSQQLAQELQAIEQQAYQAAGEVFNLASPKQLGDILFEKLGLNRKKSRQTKTGYSTDHGTLEKLQGDHPIIDSILEHRTLAKLKSTYVDALPSLVNLHSQRIHTDFNQAVTNTGRLSSSNPNLQNIPIRSAFSRQIRQAFIPEPGWILVSADYSQIELRILAHLSQEPVLLQAYQTGQDVHRLTAQLLFEKEQITPAERNVGKTINFGVIYGMGAQRFAREAGVSAEEGRQFIDRYRQTYAHVFHYLELMKKTAITTGFVQTIQGRRRYFDFSTESLKQYRGKVPESIDLEALKLSYTDVQLLRSAANAPIQGSSADIIKIAMVNLAPLLQAYQARLLLQVHDELIFEMPPQEQATLQPLIQTTMEKAVSLSVPLRVEVHSGQNWMEAK